MEKRYNLGENNISAEFQIFFLFNEIYFYLFVFKNK